MCWHGQESGAGYKYWAPDGRVAEIRSSSAASTCPRSSHDAITAAEKIENTVQPCIGLVFQSSASEKLWILQSFDVEGYSLSATAAWKIARDVREKLCYIGEIPDGMKV